MLNIKYRPSVLNSERSLALAETLRSTLNAIRAREHTRLDQHDFLGQNDKARIRDWNGPLQESKKTSTLHAPFETMVVEQPHNAAIDSWDGRLTYAELNSLSTRLAHDLQQLGIGPESMVAHCFPKSLWAIVSIVATLKAGGACVALSPEHPRERIQTILADTNAQHILVSAETKSQLQGLGVELIVVDKTSIASIQGTESVHLNSEVVGPHNAAYAIFTSGSTGVPKGIVVGHDAVYSSIMHAARLFGMGPHSRMLQFASYTFDIHLFDIFATLGCGGCICIPSDHERSNDLAGFIRRHYVNALDLTPTVASLLDPKQVPSVTRLMVGGEALTQGLIDAWTARPGLKLFNAYGPSETSPLMTWTEVIPGKASPSTIGRALGGDRLWIADPTNPARLMPLGCTGELLIEGPTLSRGYLNLPEKTAESFIDGLSWFEDGQVKVLPKPGRVYRSGDLVKYNEDGSLDYVGRKDTQVKVNGQRVELGEIEHHLNSTQRRLAECVVVYASSGPCKGKLVVLVAPSDDSSRVAQSSQVSLIDAAQLTTARNLVRSLREGIASKLPTYMIPRLWAVVDAIPLTISGKTYRSVISRWVNDLDAATFSSITSMSYAGDSIAVAETEEERLIRDIWSQVLGVTSDQIGTNQSFLSLGGDSVAAIKAVAVAGQSQTPLSVRELMAGKTIRELAMKKELPQETFNQPVQEPIPILSSEFGKQLEEAHHEQLAQISVYPDDADIHIEDVYPCSPAQQGILISQAKAPGTYTIQYLSSMNIDGGLVNIDQLQSAWQAVVDRHPALRSIFAEGNTSERPIEQLVLQNVKATFTHRHLTDHHEIDELLHLAGSDKSTSGFGCLPHSMTVFTDASGNCYLRLEISHAITDGGSITLMMRELALAYESKLPTNSGPRYRDFLNSIFGRDLTPSLSYWKEYLQDIESCHFPSLLDGLPTPQRRLCSVDADVSSLNGALSAFCKRNEVTLFHIFQAAWALVLRSYLNKDDICFGYITSGRDAPVDGIQSAIGAFMSSLACRVNFEETKTLSSALQSIRKHNNSSLDHQHLSLADMKRPLNLPGDTFFNTVIGFQTVLAKEDQESSIEINEVAVHDPTEVCSLLEKQINTCLLIKPKYDIAVIVETAGNVPAAKLEYWSDILSPSQAKHLSEALVHSISVVIAQSDNPIEVLDLTPPSQLAIMKEWSDEATQPAKEFIERESCLHAVFQRQVQLHPNATAIVAHDGELSYGELDDITTRLAHHLISTGVKPESLVPYCFSKSIWAAVSVLAILKAGGAGVPLDPTHPKARLDTILEDTNASIILTSPEHKSLFAHRAATVITLNNEFVGNLPRTESALYSEVQPHHPAFVIFTSGSTGTPKGVVLEHHSMTTNCQAYGKALRMDATSRVLQFATYTFDASIFDMCAALLLGGCVCIPSEHERMNDLAGFIERNRCNWILATSTVMGMMTPEQVPSLRNLILGGEALSRQVLDTWAPFTNLFNAYGPAEAAIMSACSSKMDSNSQASCIGKGATGAVWLTSPANHNQLVPIGSIGEITVQGPGVSRGYLNSPTKTSEAFFDSPRWLTGSNATYTRVYRTGDLGRFNSDGTIECLGRKDNQVKLRGQRLELGEIEYHISRHDQVRQGLVLKGSCGPCKERLVGLISLRSGPASGNDTIDLVPQDMKPKAVRIVSELRKTLSAGLPTYMTPTVWVVLKELPMTTSGKVYVKVLQQWVNEMSQETFVEVSEFSTSPDDVITSRGQGEKQLSGVEQQLQKIWSKVLNLPLQNIKRSSTFLGLGGDSVTAMRVMSLCRGEKLVVTVQDVLQNQSLASLARCVKSTGSVGVPQQMHEIYDTPVPVTSIQSFFFRTLPEAPNHYNQSFMLQLKHSITEERLHDALNSIVERYPLLRAHFQKSEASGLWTQTIAQCEKQTLPETYHFQHAHVESPETIVDIANVAQAQLNIAQGLVFSATLFSQPDSQSLYLVAHHLVIDLVSWRIILQDLEEILISSAPSTDVGLPYLQVATIRQQQLQARASPQIQDVNSNADLSYWGLSNAENTQGNTRHVTFTLDESASAKILGSCNTMLRTEPTDIFLAAVVNSFATVFDDRKTPAVFVEGHGRDHDLIKQLDVSGTIGWFTTISPVCLEIPANSSSDLVQSLRITRDTLRRNRTSGQYFLDQLMLNGGNDDLTLEIMFNYEGHYQQLENEQGLFRMLPIPAPDFGDTIKRSSLFDIAVIVKNGQIEFDFLFNSKSAHQDRIDAWILRTEQTLQKMADELPQMSRYYGLTDFPLLPLDYKSLGNFIADLETLASSLSPSHYPVVIQEAFPCTGTQEGLLLAQGKDASNYAVHEIAEVIPSTNDPIDTHKLRSAWAQVVERHPVLRTVFVDHPTNTGYHCQVVLEHVVPGVDLLASQSVELALEAWQMTSTSNYTMVKPPHHMSICNIADGRVLFKFEFSHSILDAQSVQILLKDFALAYAGTLDSEVTIPSFSKVMEHINRRDESDDLKFWASHLSGAESCCLPDLSGVPENNRVQMQRLDLDITAKDLQSFCKMHHVTPFAILQAAWATVLRSYTFMDQVSFGYLASGRDVPIDGIESMAGALVNMLVSHTKFSQDVTALEVVASIQKGLTDSLAHQYCSLGEIQHALELGGQPLFNTVIDFQRPGENDDSSAAFSVQNLAFHDPTEFSLTVHFELNKDALSGYVAHWTSTVAPEYALHIGEALTLALQNIIMNPQQKVSDIDLVGQCTLGRLIEINTPAPIAREECLHEIFRQHAQATPLAPAVFSTQMCLTFAELDRLSNRLGNYLADMGVGPEVKVPMCFEKSAWAIVSMFAVWKAGGCIVAIDPSHPESRIRGILEDISATLILMSSQTLEKCRDSLGDEVRPIIVDTDSLDSMPDEQARKSNVQPHNAAYINFTSGTTGKPKGVVIEHQAIVSNVEPLARTSDITPSTRALQFSSYAWDAFYCETIMPLLSGGCTCVANDDERSHDIAEFMRRAGCDWSLFTPSFARLLSPSDVPNLKTLLLGGEAMSADDKATWTKSVTLKNAYGPCEASIVALMHPDIASASSEHNLSQRLGQTIWVADPKNPNRLAPLGAPGELVLGGPPVGRGYINEPVKTAEAFITSPTWFASNSQLAALGFTEKFYRTGDLVRLNIDGTIGFIGRKDEDQVKLRGQRMELGEVEQCIMTNMPSAKQVAAAVISRSGQAEHKQLIAFVTFSGSHDASGQLSSKPQALQVSDELFKELKTLASTMAKLLPSFMIPSMFVPVTRIPLGSTTKIDRKALAEIACQIPFADVARYSLTALAEVRQPSTPLETALHGLYSEILGIPAASMSVTDGFFQRGGDSIKAIKLVSAARQANLTFTVVDIFNNPSVSALASVARFIDANATSGSIKDDSEALAVEKAKVEITKLATEEYKMKPKQIQDVYPCTELQDTMLAISLDNPGSYTMQLVTAVSEDADLEGYLDAWKAVRRNNDILRTRIVNARDHRYQVVYNDRMVIKNADSLQEYLEEDKKKLMGYGDALARFALVTEDDEQQYFVCTLHHAIYDGWSMSLIMDQISQACQWKPLSKPPPFADYVRYIQNQDRNAAEAFWLFELSGASTCDYPRLPSSSYQSSASKTTERIMSLDQQNSAGPIAAVAKTAWALLLGLYSGADDVVFATTNAGRSLALYDIADMVGPTITTVPVRVRLDRTRKVSDLVGDVHERALSAMPYEYLGLQNIRRISSDCEAACDLRSLFVVQPGDLDNVGFTGVPGVSIVPTEASGFFTQPLVVECYLGQTKLKLCASFDENVLGTQEVDRMLAQLEHLIQEINARGGEALQAIDLLSNDDKRDIFEWNADMPAKLNERVQDVIAVRAKEFASSIAVSSWDGQMTYAELDANSSRLAAYLCNEMHVMPGDLIPLSFEKSVWAMVAMLATIKAGGAFVFLDIKMPFMRQQFIINASKSNFIMSSTKNTYMWSNSQWHVIEVGKSALADLPTSPIPEVNNQPDSLLYAIYTSGSTGVPKGCLIEHSAFLSSTASYTKNLLLDTGSRVLQFSSFAFDVSIMESLGVLTVGGCVCIASEEAFESGIATMIQETQSNWASLTPSVARLMDPSSVPSLKTLALVGEPLSSEDLKTWAGNLRLQNGYGPTECSILCVINPDLRTETDAGNTGYGSGGLTWVVDPNDPNILMPVGCPGELLMEGPILARGYLNQPETTASVFVEGLKWSPRGRFYKTGDLVRYNSDGSIHCLGRKDNQVKVRGQRLEPGEIEEKIDGLSFVNNSCVVLTKTGPYANKLAGVVVLQEFAIASAPPLQLIERNQKQQAAARVTEIRDALSEVLPVYMVPEVWIMVTATPLSISGKTDRKSIRQWVEKISGDLQQEIDSLIAPNTKEAPQTDEEKKLHAIICDVLNIPPSDAGVNQSFMSLGGDSISAMRLVAKCRAAGFTINLKKILSRASISQLAGLTSKSTKQAPVRQVTASDLEKPFALTPIQQYYVDTQTQLSGDQIDNEFTGRHRFHQSFLLRLARSVGQEAITGAVRQLTQRHPMLRAAFSKNPHGAWEQRILSDITALDLVRIDKATTSEQAISAIKLANNLNTKDGQVFRAVFFPNKIDSGDQLLFMTAHHLVIDLVSWRIILDELEQILGGIQLTAPAGISFQAWAALQASYAESHLTPSKALPMELVTSDSDYWGITKASSNTYGTTVTRSLTLGKSLTSSLTGDCHDVLRTDVVDVLLASLMHAFSAAFPDRTVPTVFVEGHGREPWDESIDLGSTVGWFTTISPISVPVTAEQEPLSILRQTKDVRRSIPSNGWAYFASRYLNPEGRKAFQNDSMAEILFNFAGQFQQFENSDGLFKDCELELADEASEVGPDTTRLALIEVSSVIKNGELQMSFILNKNMQHMDRLQDWIDSTPNTLQSLLDALQHNKSTAIPTLSDFPLLRTTHDNLDTLLHDACTKVGTDDWTAVEDIYPCTPMQTAMLLSSSMDPEHYRTCAIVQIIGPSQILAEGLQSAWQRVVKHHPSLRTVFMAAKSQDAAFDQIVFRDLAPQVRIITSSDSEALDHLKAQAPADWAGASPHALTICETTNGILCRLEISHALMDGASMDLLFGDLVSAIEGRLSREPSPGYSNYVRYLQERSSDDALAYWMRYLSGADPCKVPAIKAVNDDVDIAEASVTIPVSGELGQSLTAFTEKHEVTAASVIQAAWAMVLRCFTQSTDISFGYAVAGRDIPVDGIDNIVGPFINVLPCRLDMSSESQSTLDLASRVQQDFFDSTSFQHTSLAEIQHELKFGSRALFDTVVSIQRYNDASANSSSGIQMDLVDSHDSNEVSHS